MIHIIPAAGPDFVLREKLVKLAVDFDGSSLIDKTLLNRAWRKPDDKYIFIFQDNNTTRAYFDELKLSFENVESIFLSTLTNGAADTVLAGLSIANPDTVICLDLADIIIKDNIERVDIINILDSHEALALTFESQNDSYSYLKFNEDKFVEAREKQVISKDASAGVYFYRDKRMLLHAMSKILDNPEFMFGDMNYVCPIFNGCLSVAKKPVNEIFDVKDL